MTDPLICHFAPGPYMGRYFAHLARFGPAAGIRSMFVTIGTCRPEIEEELGGHNASPCAVGSPHQRYPVRGVIQLARELRRAGADVLHAHGFHAGLAAIPASRLTGIPLVLGRHHADSVRLAGANSHVWLDRFQARAASVVVANSEFTRSWMIEQEAADPRRVVTVHYGLPPEAFEPPSLEARAAVEDEFELAGCSTVLLPARLVRTKGQLVLLDALDFVIPEPGRRLRIILLGEGPDRAALEAVVRQRQLRSTVVLAGFRPDPRPFYDVADLTVLPTTTDAFGQVLIESMAQATPVIASRVGGVPESVTPDTGILLDDLSPRALGSAISELLADPRRRRCMGAAGRELTQRRFPVGRMLAELGAVYRRVCGRTGGQ